MSRDRTVKRLECDLCSQTYQPEVRKLEGFPYTVYVCPKCGDTLFTLDQAKAYREVHLLAELAKKELGPLILRQVGNSVNATVPKELAAIGFRKGRQFQWEVQGPGVIRLRLLSDREALPSTEQDSSGHRKARAVRKSTSKTPEVRKDPSKSKAA